MNERDGQRLVDECKRHLVGTMANVSECGEEGTGARNADLEAACGFRLDLSQQKGWFTWSLLQSLAAEGAVEVLRVGSRGTRRYRLKRGC